VYTNTNKQILQDMGCDEERGDLRDMILNAGEPSGGFSLLSAA
jgi:hypothetical protein